MAARCAATTGRGASPDGWPATIPRSTRTGTATRAGSPSPMSRKATGSPGRWSGMPMACGWPPGPRRFGSPPAGPRGGRDSPAVRGVGRWPADRRGRLRLRQVRTGRRRTNDMDFRARPHSDEEPDFLAAHVVGAGPGVELHRAGGRARRAVRGVGARGGVADRLPAAAQGRPQARQRVFHLGQWSTPAVRGRPERGVAGRVPGAEAAVLGGLARGRADRAGRGRGDPGRRPGRRDPRAVSAVADLAAPTGARIGWVPRRAGERGALDAGAVPTLLPAAGR